MTWRLALLGALSLTGCYAEAATAAARNQHILDYACNRVQVSVAPDPAEGEYGVYNAVTNGCGVQATYRCSPARRYYRRPNDAGMECIRRPPPSPSAK